MSSVSVRGPQTGEEASAHHKDSSQHHTTNTRQRRGLLDLPPEIWSKIGKLVIDSSDRIHWPRIVMSWPGTVISPPIAQTCQALRQELLPYFYRTEVNVTCASGDDEDFCDRVGAWLRVLEPSIRRDLRTVKVRVSPQSSRGHVRMLGEGRKLTWKKADELWKLETELGEAERDRNGNVIYRIKFLC